MPNLWVAIYEQFKALDKSGRIDNDNILVVLQLFEQKVGRPFIAKHCWLLFQDHPRFATVFRPMESKRRAVNSEALDLPVDKREANFVELQLQCQGDDKQRKPAYATRKKIIQVRSQGNESKGSNLEDECKGNN